MTIENNTTAAASEPKLSNVATATIVGVSMAIVGTAAYFIGKRVGINIGAATKAVSEVTEAAIALTETVSDSAAVEVAKETVESAAAFFKR